NTNSTSSHFASETKSNGKVHHKESRKGIKYLNRRGYIHTKSM
uniref:Uncharacterized protein n=1 Tax=Amphimedon queenslandica TaxID=400682 RepID=A0A1X7T1G3_AMPQE